MPAALDEAPVRQLSPQEYAPQPGAPAPAPKAPTPVIPIAVQPTPGVEHHEKPPATSFSDAFKAAQKAKPKAAAQPPAAVAPAPDPKAIPVPVPAPAVAEAADEQPKDSAGWKKFHARVKEAETKLANLGKEFEAKVAEVDALKKEPKIDPKELETLKTERDTLSERLAIASLEASPKFQAHFDKRFSDAVGAAKAAVGADHAAAVEELMQLPPSKARKEQFAAIMADMDDFDRTSLTVAVRDMDAARTEKKEQLGNWKENTKKMREVEVAQLTAQQEQQRKQSESTTTQAIERALKYGESLSAFTRIEGQDAHNARVDARIAKVRDIFTGKLPPTELVNVPVLAEEALFLRENIIPKLLEENKQLQTEMAQLRTAEPSLESKGSPTGGTPKTWEPGQGDSPVIAAYKKAMGRK